MNKNEYIRKRRKLNIIESIIGVLGLSHIGAKIGAKVKTNRVEKSVTMEENNTLGFDDIGVNYNFRVHTNNFIVLHVANKSINDITYLRQKLEKCNNLGISVALVLETNADTLGEMYQDVDFLQAIIKEYKVDLPIYCNIDGIMSNKKLNNYQKSALISAFIDKASRSDMYLGLYGRDSSLCDCMEYDIYNISNYDCFVVMDSDEVNFKGNYTMYKDLEGNIRATKDLSSMIIDKGYNTSTKLVESAMYEVKEGETIHSLSLRFGLSDEDLMRYNGINEEISLGDVIYIPNLYQTVNHETNQVSYSYAIARGIDISDFQDIINWERVAVTSDFVIVEVARDSGNLNIPGTFVDECVEQIVNVVRHNLGLGLYFCIYKDMDLVIYEQRLENYLTQLDRYLNILNVSIDRDNVPVFLDCEIYSESTDYFELMNLFSRICHNHGFSKIGIYGNKSTLDCIGNDFCSLDVTFKDMGWYVWKAGGPQYSGNEGTNQDNLKIDEVLEISNDSNNMYTPAIQQVTNVCTDTGATNYMEHCDVDFLYDYEVFGEEFRERLNGVESSVSGDEAIIGSLEIDLNNYRNIPIHKVLNIVDTAINGLYVILAISVIGTKIHFKIAKNKNKTLKKNKPM